MVVSTEKKSSFLGSPRDVFQRPSAAPEPIAPKFLHTTFPSKYFVLAEFHPPRLSFGGVMPPTPSFASLHYGLPYGILQAIIIILKFIYKNCSLCTNVTVTYTVERLTADGAVLVPVVAAVVSSVAKLQVIETMLHVGTQHLSRWTCHCSCNA